MNMDFYYYEKEMDRLISAGVYADYTYLAELHPEFTNAVSYLMVEELISINNIYNEFLDLHELEIRFHTQYLLQDGIIDPKRSFERTKDKTNILDNRLSFSVSSKTSTVLIPLYLDNDFVYIPEFLNTQTNKPKALKIIYYSKLKELAEQKIFTHKKALFKELFSLIEELEFLNDKLMDYKKEGKPLIIKTF